MGAAIPLFPSECALEYSGPLCRKRHPLYPEGDGALSQHGFTATWLTVGAVRARICRTWLLITNKADQ